MSQRGGGGGRGGGGRGGHDGGGGGRGGGGGGGGGGRGGYDGGGGGGRGGYDGGGGGRGGYDGGGGGRGGGRGGYDGGGGRGGYDGGGRGGGGDRGGRGGGGGGGGGRGGGRGGKLPSTIRLVTNMYGVDEAQVEKATSKVFRYDVQIVGSTRIPLDDEGKPMPMPAPETFSASPKKISKNAVRGLALSLRELVKKLVVTDGVSSVYTLGDIIPDIKNYLAKDPVAKVSAKLDSLSISNKGGETVLFNVDRNGKRYAVQLKHVKWDSNDRLEKAQMLQVAVQFSFFAAATEQNKNFYLTTRSLFTDDRKTIFGENSDLMLFTGIYQSFRYNGANKPMVNIDVTHFPALRNDLSLLQYLYMLAGGKDKLIELLRKTDFVKFVNENIKDKNVRARYGSNVTYKLGGLDMDFTPDTAKFELTERKKAAKLVSVREYMNYKKIAVKEQYQPLVVAKVMPRTDEGAGGGGDAGGAGGAGGAAGGGGGGKKKKGKGAGGGGGGGGSSGGGGGGGGGEGEKKGRTPTWLLPELLEFSIGESRRENLDAQERSDMIRLTRQEPNERFGGIENNANDIRTNKYWQNFAISILDKLQTEARVLVPVELVYAKGVRMQPVDGTWNLDGLRLFETPTEQRKWCVVYPQNRFDDVNAFVPHFVDLSIVSGYDITKEPYYTEIPNPSRGNEYVQGLRWSAKEYKDCAFYLIVLPDKDATRYQNIKAVSNTELGIATQCVVLDGRRPPPGKVSKTTDKSVLGNIIAGINPKLSFQNCIVAPEKLSACLGGIQLDGMMVMGLDVFHGDTKDPEARPSVVALCAATNVNFTKYATALRTQSARQEIVECLDSMVAEVMVEYIAKRKVPPKRIFFYRDGVGEGMYDAVKEKEIDQLMRTIGKICQESKVPNPTLTFVVVQKRNHLRTLAKDTYKGNPYPGTLIDDKNIVDGGRPNFYLYSHKALAGTARPTHYQVLEDFNKFTIQQLAEFTYALAHLHQGCTKAVSLPAPVFYADRACGMAGACFRLQVQNLDKELKKTLFMI